MYCSDLINNFPNGGILDYTSVPEAQTTYTEVLASQPDASVTLLAIGFPMNIRNMLENEYDLFTSKVKEIYWMNGFWNFGCALEHKLGPVDDCLGSSMKV